MAVNVFPASTFYDFMEAKGKTGGQHKFPRVLKKQDQITEWESFLAKRKAY